jgi:hypothetical protein
MYSSYSTVYVYGTAGSRPLFIVKHIFRSLTYFESPEFKSEVGFLTAIKTHYCIISYDSFLYCKELLFVASYYTVYVDPVKAATYKCITIQTNLECCTVFSAQWWEKLKRSNIGYLATE